MSALHRVVICLLTFISIQSSYAQIQSSADSIIQMWRWESEDGYSTVDICSPHLVLLEGKAYEFELFHGAFYFLAGRTSIPYRYDEARVRLTLIFPEGPPLEYHRTISSVYFRRLTNQNIYNGRALYGRFCSRTYYPIADGPGEYKVKAIAFWSNSEFDFSSGAVYASLGTGGSAVLGTAVLSGNAVVMSFYDGRAAEAQVIERNSFGEVTRIEYAGEKYALNECESVEPPPPPPPEPDPDYPPNPPDPPQPPPGPGRPGGNIRGPASTSPAPSPSGGTDRPSQRPMGDTRGTSTSSTSSGDTTGNSSGSTSQSGAGRPGGTRR